MIPTDDQINALWDIYHVPQQKRQHLMLVGRVALFLAKKIKEKTSQSVDEKLLHAAALLHDIDKAVPPMPGERHPDTAVRIVESEGMDEVARLVRKHPLHAICDPDLAPSSWEEKLLYLSDKMVKYEIITVDKRFDLWRAEKDMPSEGKQVLEKSYPLVKKLEKEILDLIGIQPADVAKLA
jgi:putative nucleotidyltransferase with HDIG domain